MKAILSTAVLFAFCGVANAQAKAEPVGTWKCSYEIGDQKRESTLTVKKDGDKYAGTMSWPDQKEAKLTDVKFKDGELTFSAVREFMDNKIAIDYKFKVEADTIKGKAEADFGGNKQSFDIEGKREKKDK